jgi:hypothetical protein
MKVYRALARASPNNLVRGLSLQEIGELRRFVTVIEELVERHFQSPSELL